MKTTSRRRNWLTSAACSASLAIVAISSTGCQSTVGGQTLPSPYYYQDDVQYFAPGPDFKLHREATKMKQFRTDQDLIDAGG